MIMWDSVAKRGRPRLPNVPKMSCLKKRSEQNSNGFMYDNTVWHKNVDSFRGLKVDKKCEKKKTNNFLFKEEIENKRWKTHNDIVLTEADKYIITDNKWISDSIVNASQSLLQKQYPHIKGLQNVLLCGIDASKQIDWNKLSEYQNNWDRLTQMMRTAATNIETMTKKRNSAETQVDLAHSEKSLAENEQIYKQSKEELAKLCQFEVKIEGLQPLEKSSKFVQVLLDKTVHNQNHWFCVSNVKTNDFKTVRIYDNDLNRINNSIENYSVSLKSALKRLYRNSGDIRMELPLVSQSYDRCSGGVYAIAFAQALCEGFDPSDLLFTDSPKQMRLHLYDCLERAEFSRFPTGKHSILFITDLNRNCWKQSKEKRKENQK